MAGLSSMSESISLPVRLDSKNPNPKSLTVLLVGVTGRGKTSFCNFLSKSKCFKTGIGMDAIDPKFSTHAPQIVNVDVRIPNKSIRTLSLLDTPGHLSTSLLHLDGEILKESEDSTTLGHYRHALILAKDGIHAILIVMEAGSRVGISEEFRMFKLIKSLDLWQRCIVLFTYGNRLGSNDDERYSNFHKKLDSGSIIAVFKETVKLVNNRFIIVESVDPQINPDSYYKSKLDELVSTVELVYDKCGLFATEEFRLAQESWKAACLEQSLKQKEQKLTEKTTAVGSLKGQLKAKDDQLQQQREEMKVLCNAIEHLEEKLFVHHQEQQQPQQQQKQQQQQQRPGKCNIF